MKYRVGPEEAGWKIREVLRRSMGVSYTALKSAKWNGRIRLNGETARADARVEDGDLVKIDWEEDVPVYQLKPYEFPLEIPYEDEHLLVVAKPGGIASQSSRNHPDDSLENAVYSYYRCPENFIYQHRLQQELHTPAFRRRYLALTDGIPAEEEGMLDFPIAKVPGATIKRMIAPDGKPSRTRYRVLEKRNGGALILLELETGRTHQIRVHLSHIGCPVRGDFLYGEERPEEFPGCFALHSAMVELRHPLTGETLRLTSLPQWAGELDDSVLFMDFN